MHAQMAAAADSSATPIERLMLALDAHLAFIERYPEGYRELLSGAMSHPEVRAIMENERTALLEMVLADRGIDRAHLTELCSRALYGAILAAIEVDKKT